MSAIREDLVRATLHKISALTDLNICNDIHKQFESIQQTILADESFTDAEKTEAIKIINEHHDRYKVLYNEGTKRICENCNQECLATTYCEFCVRNHLKVKFSNWTSGNDNIDNLIQTCQLNTLEPDGIIEWIPYDNLQNIKYLTKGGFSKIYTAGWIDGCYYEWDSEKQQLTRKFESKSQAVVLKKLQNIENANQSWLEEARSHLTISNKWPEIVQCFGLTQDPSDGNYMLVMNKMDIDLRNYLQQNHNQLTWKKGIQIVDDIVTALDSIHIEGAIHRDLHSGNILFRTKWCISDLGFCGPVDKSSESIYGNLPYIAPEVFSGKGYTFASDIYSVGMLMWEISSGQPPFSDYKYDTDADLALSIIDGIRPRVIPGTPPEYISLMKQCWDADPSKRPDIDMLMTKIGEMNLQYHNKSDGLIQQVVLSNDSKANYISSKLFTSKVRHFKDMSEPKNATEEEQEAFYRDSKMYEISIPDNVTSSGNLSKVFDKLQIDSEESK